MRRGERLGWAEAFLAPGLGSNGRRERIDRLVEWERLERLLARVRPGESGRPPCAALTMFQALLLQQWYGLSDPGLEEALGDRLSLRRFCGLGLDQGTPDETTIWRFREALLAAGLADRLLAAPNRQLDARGLMVEQGRLLEATLVAAQAAAPPLAAGVAAKSPHDADAAWTRQRGKARFGYKAHVAMEQGSRLIRRARPRSTRARWRMG